MSATGVALRRLAVGLSLAAACWWGAGTIVVSPRRTPLPEAPAEVSPVVLAGPQGALQGWLRGDPGTQGCALLLHGNGADRRQMVPRMETWSALGWASLALDLQAHGESDGAARSLGVREQHDVVAAVAWLRAQGCPGGVVVNGFSLGAASALLSASTHGADAMIVEACFARLPEAVHDRLATVVGPLASWLAPLLLPQVKIRFGVAADQVAPIEAASRAPMPVMVVAGEEDPRVSVQTSRALHEALLRPGPLLLLPGLGHQDAAVLRPEVWRRDVARFLHAAHLPRTGPPPLDDLAVLEGLARACRVLTRPRDVLSKAWIGMQLVDRELQVERGLLPDAFILLDTSLERVWMEDDFMGWLGEQGEAPPREALVALRGVGAKAVLREQISVYAEIMCEYHDCSYPDTAGCRLRWHDGTDVVVEHIDETRFVAGASAAWAGCERLASGLDGGEVEAWRCSPGKAPLGAPGGSRNPPLSRRSFPAK
jgi:pimeloyl-ACP methyl ester carboxylesterase